MSEQTTEHQRDMWLNERLTNLIRGRAWLAEGRGQYAYNDGRYDDEVMCFVAALLEVLPVGTNEPIQSWMTKAEQAIGQLSATTWQDWQKLVEAERANTGEAMRQLAAARADAEHYDDLYDWAKRWQAGRRANTEEHKQTPKSREGNLMARIILDAKAMNEELDSILESLQTGEATDGK